MWSCKLWWFCKLLLKKLTTSSYFARKIWDYQLATLLNQWSWGNPLIVSSFSSDFYTFLYFNVWRLHFRQTLKRGVRRTGLMDASFYDQFYFCFVIYVYYWKIPKRNKCTRGSQAIDKANSKYVLAFINFFFPKKTQLSRSYYSIIKNMLCMVLETTLFISTYINASNITLCAVYTHCIHI